MECPVCKKRMHLRRMEGINIDVCEDHGVWLDKGEIEELMATAKRRGESEGVAKGLYNATHLY